MAKQLTKADYLRLRSAPRRRFQSVALEGSRMKLHGRVAAPCYWFEQNDMYEADGKYWRMPSHATVSLVVDGKQSVFFYLVGRRLDTCTFAYDLTLAQLEKAVVAMKRARLRRLIAPAAEWAFNNLPPPQRETLEGALWKLIRRPERTTRARKAP
jgi:hypothetical protein